MPVGTLRSWEQRYGLVVPERSTGGQRLFTRAQVDHLRAVKDQLDAGLTPADAHRVLGEQLDEPAAAGRPTAPDRSQSDWRNDAGAAWPSENETTTGNSANRQT